jgi:hypothetical protein
MPAGRPGGLPHHAGGTHQRTKARRGDLGEIIVAYQPARRIGVFDGVATDGAGEILWAFGSGRRCMGGRSKWEPARKVSSSSPPCRSSGTAHVVDRELAPTNRPTRHVHPASTTDRHRSSPTSPHHLVPTSIQNRQRPGLDHTSRRLGTKYPRMPLCTLLTRYFLLVPPFATGTRSSLCWSRLRQ